MLTNRGRTDLPSFSVLCRDCGWSVVGHPEPPLGASRGICLGALDLGISCLIGMNRATTVIFRCGAYQTLTETPGSWKRIIEEGA